jgi:MFS transporter, OFA family, oxalate/formate antiporter
LSSAITSGYTAFTLFLYNSCLGVFLSYGVFFNRVSMQYNLPASATSIVFGIFAILFSISSLLLGLFMGKKGPGKTIMIGGSLMALGLVLSSIANSYASLVLAYGVVGGLGSGAMWMPTSYVVFDRFDPASTRWVTGFVSTGTAVGLLFFAPLENYLIVTWSMQASFLIVGLIVFLFTMLAYQSSKRSQTMPKLAFREALRSLKTKRFGFLYVYYSAGNAFSRTLVIIFLVPLLESRGLGSSAGTLALVLIGVGSLIGRLTASIQGVTEEMLAATGFILQGICAISLFLSNNTLTTGVLSVLFGIGYGAYVPEFALLVRKYYGLQHYGTIFGVLMTSFGIGAFIGPVFEGVAVSSALGYFPGFLLATIVSLAVGVHLLIKGRAKVTDDQRTGFPRRPRG